MSNILVIAEKPSVSAALAKVLGAYKREDGYLVGSGYIVSWCLGHLAEFAPPDVYDSRYKKWSYEDLPIIPQDWKLVVDKDKKKQFDILVSLMNPTYGVGAESPRESTVSSEKDFLFPLDYIVNACDAGHERELIFRRIYELSGCTLPVKRLWISSMEDAAIREGFLNLSDGLDYENLYSAGDCRSKADWLIGMNATRAYSVKYNHKLTVGRVQTPTLALLTRRQEQIRAFKKESFYKVKIEGDGLTAFSENISDKESADMLADLCDGQTAEIRKVERKRKSVSPPKLYDLTTLQREANRLFGYSAKVTLQELQKLYEAKMVTYPRTDSQYVTQDMAGTVMELLAKIPEKISILKNTMDVADAGSIVDNAKVTDHHALLPTKSSFEEDLSQFSEIQRNLYAMICVRLASAVAAPSVYDETTAEVICAGHEFSARGKAEVKAGFQRIEMAFADMVKEKGNGGKETKNERPFPDWIRDGMVLEKVSVKSEQHFTSPPKAFTEDTLLSAMESAGKKLFVADTEKKGLGTPATRADIIEKIIACGYAVRSKRQIIPTDAGMQLIEVLPEYLKSADLTADWENELLGVERGETEAVRFMQDIKNLTYMILHSCDRISEEERKRFDTREKIGDCPVCGKPVYEGKQNFYCSDRACRFALWKENRYLSGMKKNAG